MSDEQDQVMQPRPYHRDVWVQMCSAALTGVLVSKPNFTDDMAVKLAGKIADQALHELRLRESKPDYQAIFQGKK